MKSRTSFFNPTVLKKDLLRYAPVWGLYTVINFIIFLFTSLGKPAVVVGNVCDLLEASAVLNFIYALVIALTVFSDPFRFRTVGVLHAMPLRREGWFLTHTVSSLLMGIVPNALLALVILPLVRTVYPALPSLWLLACTLEFLFFFGLAVLSCQLAGNRLGAAFVYGIINFAALLIFVLVDALYVPTLYGIELSVDGFSKFCPVVWLRSNEFIHYNIDYEHDVFTLLGQNTGKWWYLAVCSAIGIGLWAGALLLFRKRHMETAGDLIAVRSMAPLYLAMHMLLCGAFFYFLDSIFFSAFPSLLYGIGMIVGYFTGLMLLHRTVQIFKPKSLLIFLSLAVIIIGSVFLAAADPLGRVSYVPDPEDVASVTIENETANPEVIAEVTELHRALIHDRGDDWHTIPITYQLKSGKIIRRYYDCPLSGQTYQLAKSVLSRPELVFGTDDFGEFSTHIQWIYADIDNFSVLFANDSLSDFEHLGFIPDLTLQNDELQELLDAIASDCAEGRMAQQYFLNDNAAGKTMILSFLSDNADADSINEFNGYRDVYPDYLDIWDSGSHTMQYLKQIAAAHNIELTD